MSKLALYEDDTRTWGLIEGDALMVLVKLPDHSVDAIVCDPPYGLGFRGETWDGKDIHHAAGSELLIPNEAFQRWTTAWATQCQRVLKPGGHLLSFGAPRTFHRLVSGIEDGGLEIRDTLMWVYATGVPKSRRLPGGQGTTLKPAYEPILLARAPLAGSAKATIDRWGTGALNIDACRAGKAGYWPANLALSHAPDCPAALIDQPSEGPSRLLFCSKTSKAEREGGCEQLAGRQMQIYNGCHQRPRLRRNVHPTVKPVSLMRWLVRLAVPPGGLVLDPFAGSGSTGIATVLERRTFLGIEREAEYVDIACARLTHHAHMELESAA